jgi:hypothetical protein
MTNVRFQALSVTSYRLLASPPFLASPVTGTLLQASPVKSVPLLAGSVTSAPS